jgi:hypothetical protein
MDVGVGGRRNQSPTLGWVIFSTGVRAVIVSPPRAPAIRRGSEAGHRGSVDTPAIGCSAAHVVREDGYLSGSRYLRCPEMQQQLGGQYSVRSIAPTVRHSASHTKLGPSGFMSIYSTHTTEFPKWALNLINTQMANCLWNDTKDKRKLHLVN